MRKRLSGFFGSLWPLRGLRAKILWPVLGLMTASLLVSTVAFIGGTVLTRNRLLEQRLEQDTTRVIQVLTSRADLVLASAKVMAAHGEIRQALGEKTEANLALVDSQAVIVRNRFGLDLIQIYDARGNAWVNLVTTELFRVSSLLPEAQEGSVKLILVHSRPLLIGCSRTADGGTIITGIDLGSELRRITRGENLGAVIGLRWGEADVTTEAGLSFAELEHSRDYFTRRAPLLLADEEVVLLLGHSAMAINQLKALELLGEVSLGWSQPPRKGEGKNLGEALAELREICPDLMVIIEFAVRALQGCAAVGTCSCIVMATCAR